MFHIFECNSLIAVCARKIGVTLDGLVEAGNRVVVVPETAQHTPLATLCPYETGVILDDLIEADDRIILTSEVLECKSHILLCFYVSRIELDDLFVRNIDRDLAFEF